MRLVSWNVNGIRAAVRNGFWSWLEDDGPDILCLQETRIQPEQLTPKMHKPPGYHALWHAGERRGYSGVATLSRERPGSAREGFGQPRFDVEGRTLLTRHRSFTLLNVYFPNGGRGYERVLFKIDFYDALLAYCGQLRSAGERLVVCGDFNTSHQPIDLARPKENEKTSGFLPEEREALSRWLDAGFVDVYRQLHPDKREYTWWTYRFDARARDIGWRLDYFLLTEDLLPDVRDARILGDVQGSDHCPIALELDL
ncbi:MAG: exodeoxyribonuclease III [Anaerolineae bacterium]|nr:exodeoxyribonuclease III [Anaerolineae bacterium]